MFEAERIRIATLALLLAFAACTNGASSGDGADGWVDAAGSAPDAALADRPVDGGGGAEVLNGPCVGASDGSPCDDGDACTLSDVCSGGLCVGGVNDPCDEGGSCQSSACDPIDGCLYEDLADGAVCEISCFLEARCLAGECQALPGTEQPCPSPDPEDGCVAELLCDPLTGECDKEIFRLAGAPCDTDGNLCTLEACDDGGGGGRHGRAAAVPASRGCRPLLDLRLHPVDRGVSAPGLHRRWVLRRPEPMHGR